MSKRLSQVFSDSKYLIFEKGYEQKIVPDIFRFVVMLF